MSDEDRINQFLRDAAEARRLGWTKFPAEGKWMKETASGWIEVDTPSQAIQKDKEL